jgi:hypothetical protein
MKPVAIAAPPVYKPSLNSSVAVRPLPALLLSSSAVLQQSKKQEKEKNSAKQAEQNRQSKSDRNKNRLNQYQTPVKNTAKQKLREDKAAEIGQQGGTIAHGFGGQGSGVSGKAKKILSGINDAELPSSKISNESQSSYSAKKSVKSGNARMPPEEYKQGRQKAANCAKSSSGSMETAKAAYINYCRRVFTQYGFTDENFEGWFEAWAEEQQPTIILDEHPSEEKPPFKDHESDDDSGGGPSDFANLGGLPQGIVV